MKKVAPQDSPHTSEKVAPDAAEVPVPTAGAVNVSNQDAGKELPEHSLSKDAVPTIPATLPDPEVEATIVVDPVEAPKASGAEDGSEVGEDKQKVWSPSGDAPWEGGYSQWREECEHRWSEWQWPPSGWRPSWWQRAYWDQESEYYKYNEHSDAFTTPPKTSPETVTGSQFSRSPSDVSVSAVKGQLARCNTGELRVDLETRMDEGGAKEAEGPSLDDRIAERAAKLKDEQDAATAQAADAKKSGRPGILERGIRGCEGRKEEGGSTCKIYAVLSQCQKPAPESFRTNFVCSCLRSFY